MSGKGTGNEDLPTDIVNEYYRQLAEITQVEGQEDMGIPKADAESYLERLLASLSKLPDLEEFQEDEEAKEHIEEELVPVGGDSNEAVVRKTYHRLPGKIWALLSREQSLDFSSLDAEMINSPAYQWGQGFNLIGSLITRLNPLEVHAVTLQAILYLDGLNEQQAGNTLLYTTTCLLLCCIALQECPTTTSAPTKADATPKTAPMAENEVLRVKRWRSVSFETIRLFQKQVDKRHLRDVFFPLWLDHTLPSASKVLSIVLHHLKQQEEENKGNEGDEKQWNEADSSLLTYAAFTAGVVSTSTYMALALCRQRLPKKKTPVGQSALGLVSEELQRLLVGLLPVIEGKYAEVLWCHPWRIRGFRDRRRKLLATRTRNSMNTQEAALAYYTLQSEEGQEKVAHMETAWNSVGMALLAAVGWETMRPFVYANAYLWKIWFPHVATLLDPAIHPDEEEEEDLMKSKSVVQQELGYQLLKALLQGQQNESLTKPPLEHPDSPIGTMQMLTNRIVAGSLKGEGSATQDVLPSGSQAYDLMKSLFAKYKSASQVQMTVELVRQCPHAEMKPKLLDLLRNIVNCKDIPTETLKEAWGFVGSFLSELERHLDEKKTPEGTMPIFSDAETLLDSVEMHTAALGIVRLWMLEKKAIPDIPNLSNRLITAQDALKNTKTVWKESSSEPEKAHRLNLLEDVLSECMNLVKELQ